MKTLPGNQAVGRAFKAVNTAIRAALKRTNRRASELLAKGDYRGAELLISKAKAADAFQVEVKALHQRWRDLASADANGDSSSKERTPLWAYYVPVLQAIQALGGEAALPAIQQKLEDSRMLTWKPGDLDKTAGGQPRWGVMVRKTRAHLIREGWLERKPIKTWRLTEAGKAAASKAGA